MTKTARKANVRLYGGRPSTGSSIRAHAQRHAVAPGSLLNSTEAKNKFGQLLERAIRGDVIVITKHDTAKAVLMSMEDFNALSGEPANKLETLTAEFDRMLERMQSPKAKKAARALFRATPEELGRAALRGARKRN